MHSLLSIKLFLLQDFKGIICTWTLIPAEERKTHHEVQIGLFQGKKFHTKKCLNVTFPPSVLNTPVTLIHFSAPTQTDRKQQFQYKRFSVEMQLMEWKFCKLHKPTFLYHARGLHFPTSWFPIKHSCSKRNPEISTRGAAAVIRDLLIWKLCQCFPHTSCKFSSVLLDLFTVKELPCVNRNPKALFSCLQGWCSAPAPDL